MENFLSRMYWGLAGNKDQTEVLTGHKAKLDVGEWTLIGRRFKAAFSNA